jgi:hypothetical protein
MLRLFIPTQISEDFTINHLPSKIISFILSLVQIPPYMTPSSKARPRIPCDPGNAGLNSVNKLELQTHYLSSLKSRTGTDYLEPFVKPCAKEPSHQEGSRISSSGHAEPPWTTWHRPSKLWTDPPDPQCDDTGDVAFLLQRQYRGYRNSDPGEVQQKAITPTFLRKVASLSMSHLDVAICQLLGYVDPVIISPWMAPNGEQKSFAFARPISSSETRSWHIRILTFYSPIQSR